MNIIDTKSDLAFKKVFGEKPHLLISLLNNFLPLTYPIISIEYLSPEIIPDLNDGKNSIVDVRCTDNHGRHFIVEMQVARQTGFIKRVLMNTTKVYSRQYTKDKKYNLAQPVYSLNLLDHEIKPNEIDWYHHFTFTNRSNPLEFWEEMQIIFVELPKWKKLNKFDINKTQDRWLMYFTEPTLFDRLSKEEYARYKEISEAMESLENKNFTPEQIYGYELYLDSIHQYHTTMSIERQEGREEGRQEGIEKMKKNLESALTDLKEGNSIEEVATRYDLELPYVDMLYRQFVAK
jgi:predicted transposase/invertase (TIGR01784 family)